MKKFLWVKISASYFSEWFGCKIWTLSVQKMNLNIIFDYKLKKKSRTFKDKCNIVDERLLIHLFINFFNYFDNEFFVLCDYLYNL